jgi:hypothetical protein
MTIFQKAWWNKAASNVSHVITNVVTGIEHNVGGVLGSVESHVKADVVQAVNGASSEVNHLAGLAATTTTTLATGAESTLKVPLMIAALAGGIYLVMMKKPM